MHQAASLRCLIIEAAIRATVWRGADAVMTYIQCILAWAEKHSGLGGWVGAAGAVIAIFVTWALARAEYQRTKRQESVRKLAEIDLFLKIITAFEAQVQHYKDLGPDDPEAVSFPNLHLNDPEWHSMKDLAFLPVVNWPTLEIYAEFKRYWSACTTFLQMAGTTNTNKGELYTRWQTAHDDAFSTLISLLRAARGDC